MANVSIPKVLLGIVYTLIPLLLWFVPSISEQLPEEWMVAAIVGVVVLIGFIFVMKQGNKPVRIIAIILLVLAAVYAGYKAYPGVMDDFSIVDANYEAEEGAFYSTEETAFQVKQQVIIARAIGALPTFADVAWLTTLIMILVLGCIGMKEVFSYAAIPSTHTSRTLDSNAEITDADIEASSVRPTAEQRAEALAKQKAAQAQNTIRQQNASQGQTTDETNTDPQAEPVINIKQAEPADSSSTGSPFSFTSMQEQTQTSNETPAPEPVIKTAETSNMSPTSTMDTKFSKRYSDEPPVTSAGKINIKIDLEEDPQITVENATVYKSADGQTSYYKDSQPTNPFDELKREAAEAGIKHEDDTGNPSGFYEKATTQTAAIPQFTSPFEQKTAPAPEPAPAPVQPEPVPVQPTPVAPVQPEPVQPALEPVPEPAKPASQPAQTDVSEPNPFAAMGSPFEKKKAEAPQPSPAPVQPEPVAQAPAAEPAQTAAPETAQAIPKVVLPQPEPEQAPAPAKSEQSKTEATSKNLPAKPEKPKMSEEEKQRIKELNKQVADLKTLYNQGMISQDEYIAQRTEILRKMYNNDK